MFLKTAFVLLHLTGLVAPIIMRLLHVQRDHFCILHLSDFYHSRLNLKVLDRGPKPLISVQHGNAYLDG